MLQINEVEIAHKYLLLYSKFGNRAKIKVSDLPTVKSTILCHFKMRRKFKAQISVIDQHIWSVLGLTLPSQA